MQIVSFDASQEIPIIDAVVRGPRDFHRVRLVFDTGSGLTQFDTNLVETLGYSASDGDQRLVIVGATGEEVEGYSLCVESLTLLGRKLEKVRIGVFDFSHYDRYRIHGLFGWDIIKQLHLDMDGPAGILKVF